MTCCWNACDVSYKMCSTTNVWSLTKTLSCLISQWDSTSHLTLIMAIEDDFDVRLNAREASELLTLPQILDVLRKKMNTNSIPGRFGTEPKP